MDSLDPENPPNLSELESDVVDSEIDRTVKSTPFESLQKKALRMSRQNRLSSHEQGYFDVDRSEQDTAKLKL